MKKNGIRLDLHQLIYSDNGVNFLTAHGSKGLEFEHVFMIGCNKKIWDSKGRNMGFSYPDTLMQAPADVAGRSAPLILCGAYPRKAMPHGIILGNG
jgi:DNA helicase-2/ATP-dependent DNA helicase PcrA